MLPFFKRSPFNRASVLNECVYLRFAKSHASRSYIVLVQERLPVFFEYLIRNI